MWQIKIIDKGFKPTLEIFVYEDIGNGKIRVVQGDTIQTIDRNAPTDLKPTIELPREALQAFADSLDQMGIKPQKGFLEGKLQATEKHLEDMRDLVFNKK